MGKDAARDDDLQRLTGRMQRFCAYQERSLQDVRRKLASLGCSAAMTEQILRHLQADGYVNEERYAATVARGRLHLKGWGKRKIAHMLQRKGIEEAGISAALSTLSDEDYLNTLRREATKKLRTLPKEQETARHKLAAYLMRKGFEPELIWKEVNHLLP
ncbi:MAG: regulatory protein RecX [Chitinophagales bacterium]|nr:recombination regulator RecX [Chitinophagales bacterium]MDW8393216.1 regulatory protein RecX [Chitinophagales bacterium]